MIKENKHYTICRTVTKEMIDFIYSRSALAIENLHESSIIKFVEWLYKNTTIYATPLPVYVIKGKMMNDRYQLTGVNAYEDNVNIVVVTEIDYALIAGKRLDINGRWFNEIVNKRLQKTTFNTY